MEVPTYISIHSDRSPIFTAPSTIYVTNWAWTSKHILTAYVGPTFRQLFGSTLKLQISTMHVSMFDKYNVFRSMFSGRAGCLFLCSNNISNQCTSSWHTCLPVALDACFPVWEIYARVHGMHVSRLLRRHVSLFEQHMSYVRLWFIAGRFRVW